MDHWGKITDDKVFIDSQSWTTTTLWPITSLYSKKRRSYPPWKVQKQPFTQKHTKKSPDWIVNPYRDFSEISFFVETVLKVGNVEVQSQTVHVRVCSWCMDSSVKTSVIIDCRAIPKFHMLYSPSAIERLILELDHSAQTPIFHDRPYSSRF